jgi:hypothetical protein
MTETFSESCCSVIVLYRVTIAHLSRLQATGITAEVLGAIPSGGKRRDFPFCCGLTHPPIKWIPEAIPQGDKVVRV